MAPTTDVPAERSSPIRQGNRMVSYAGLDSEQIQALRLEAQQIAQGSPADLAEKQIGLLYEEDIHDATKRILNGIKERGDGATKQEQTVLDHFSVALDWIKAAEDNHERMNNDFAGIAEAKARGEAEMMAVVRAVRGEDSSGDE